MSDLQHERIAMLAGELKLTALPDLYGPIAQDAARRKGASYAVEQAWRRHYGRQYGRLDPCA